jgi:hypothetical protein
MHLAAWAVVGIYAEIVLRKKDWAFPSASCLGFKKRRQKVKSVEYPCKPSKREERP